jgi:hypothetical protein
MALTIGESTQRDKEATKGAHATHRSRTAGQSTHPRPASISTFAQVRSPPPPGTQMPSQCCSPERLNNPDFRDEVLATGLPVVDEARCISDWARHRRHLGRPRAARSAGPGEPQPGRAAAAGRGPPDGPARTGRCRSPPWNHWWNCAAPAWRPCSRSSTWTGRSGGSRAAGSGPGSHGRTTRSGTTGSRGSGTPNSRRCATTRRRRAAAWSSCRARLDDEGASLRALRQLRGLALRRRPVHGRAGRRARRSGPGGRRGGAAPSVASRGSGDRRRTQGTYSLR